MKTTAGSHPRSKTSEFGFTLLELLTVIAIIGILAAISLPALSGVRRRARIAAAKAQLEQIEVALESYYAESDTYPPMGNDWLRGDFFPSEDVGRDGKGPFKWDDPSSKWIVNDDYPGPDTDGTEGNYELDPGEDLGLDNIYQDPYDKSGTPNAFSDNDGNLLEPSLGEGNGRLDGTYYDRMSMFATEDTGSLIDFFSPGNAYYHYYAGHVRGKTDKGMPKFRGYDGLEDYLATAPTYYNKWVLYSVGPDGRDHGLHNYYLVMQDGEDVGSDGFASDVMDDGTLVANAYSDNDRILFEPNTGENDNADTPFVAGPVRETGWTTTPGGMSESTAPGGSAALDGPQGKPVFSYDVRMERRGESAVYAMPDGDGAAAGVIMRYGP
jgi:general secretion pathway protein G